MLRILHATLAIVGILVLKMLTLVWMCLGGVALLAATYGAFAVLLPLATPYVPQSLGIGISALLGVICTVVVMAAIAYVLWFPFNWVTSQLDDAADHLIRN